MIYTGDLGHTASVQPPEMLAPDSKRGWRLEISHVGNTDGDLIKTVQLKASLVGSALCLPPWPEPGNADQDPDALARGRKQNKPRPMTTIFSLQFQGREF